MTRSPCSLTGSCGDFTGSTCGRGLSRCSGEPSNGAGVLDAARRLAPGISVVIPSRNGRELLARCLPLLQGANEITVVDNGSDDETSEFLRDAHPKVVVEHSVTPLSFADAVNRGARRAGRSHVCLLNNDMLVAPGFLAAFCARPSMKSPISSPPRRKSSCPKAAAARKRVRLSGLRGLPPPISRFAASSLWMAKT